MANIQGNAYALTILSPIIEGHFNEIAYSDEIKARLEQWNMLPNSPMTRVPQTYLCRYFVLDDVVIQSTPGTDIFGPIIDLLSIFSDKVRRGALPQEDHLASKYLVFSTNFHGELEPYLRAMWNAIGKEIIHVWGFCYGFKLVHDADSFVTYMKKCQLTASLFFVGSNDESLDEQLKALYLKQQFTNFALRTQGMPVAELQKEFNDFILRVEPANVTGPSWKAGQYRLDQHERTAL
ncbi:hypothetical protein [Glaciimonas immobilis]|uniref:Uncharacterized protein n=1 Tax=Glaciimonas immobilis TaxID=728004 RepID=A0A840RYK4_9BURK|nr:hypothetical protein [Glaciimonas immobilis]KAF3998644.1 hypothetical protein HAV38_07270 [Glaciimonas immobilis]MBB5201510.1 hypothetical protein [Glaciimonas immobilis]